MKFLKLLHFSSTIKLRHRFLEMMADEVRERRFASFVRLEVQDTMPEYIRDKLIDSLDGITLTDVITVPHRAPLGFGTIDSLPVNFGMEIDMLYSPWSPRTHPRLETVRGEEKSIFDDRVISGVFYNLSDLLHLHCLITGQKL